MGLPRFNAHTDLVMELSFSPDGKRLTSASWDDTARVWAVATGAEPFILYGNQSNVFGVSFSSDGT